ncbi:unnamed protein product [Ectocarpus sp. 12 AP-2014]
MWSPVSCTEAEGITTKARKIRLKPQKGQEKVLREWMKSARQTYNEALRLVKAKKAKPNLLLNKLVVTSRETDKNSRLESMKSTPADVRKSATRDLVKDFKSACAAYKARLRKVRSGKVRIKKMRKSGKFKGRRRYKKRKPFEVKFKSRRLTSDSIELEKKSISFENNTVSFFGTSKHSLEVRTSEVFSEESGRHKPSQSCRIAYCFGRWYIIIPEKVRLDKADINTSEARVIGIDPGCGHLKKDLGAAKTYLCRECGLVIDRDVNSGYNIMVRCASEHHAAETTLLGKRKSQM